MTEGSEGREYITPPKYPWNVSYHFEVGNNRIANKDEKEVKYKFFVGETGLGKSTLMDSLFNTNFESTPSSHKVR